MNNYANILSMLQHAKASGIKYPQIQVKDFSNGKTLVLRLAGEKSRYCGTVSVGRVISSLDILSSPFGIVNKQFIVVGSLFNVGLPPTCNKSIYHLS